MTALDSVNARYANDILDQFAAFRRAICDCHDADSARIVSKQIDDYCKANHINLADRPSLLDGYGEMLAMLIGCVPETEEEKSLFSMSSEELDAYFRAKYPEEFNAARMFDDWS